MQGVAMRLMLVRVLAGLFAASWLVLPGFGAMDLSVTWDADWPQVLEAGWGLFATVIVGAAFVLACVRPRGSAPARAQLVIAIVALLMSAVFAREGRLLLLAALLAVQTAIVDGLLRGARPSGAHWWALRPAGVSRTLLAVACAGLIPWLVYALQMWALNRESRSDSDVTIGIDHYSMQGALALSVGLLPVAAALRVDVRPFVSVCASIAASYLGLVSLVWSDSAGGLSGTWSAAAIAWALALLTVTTARGLRAVPLPERSGG